MQFFMNRFAHIHHYTDSEQARDVINDEQCFLKGKFHGNQRGICSRQM